MGFRKFTLVVVFSILAAGAFPGNTAFGSEPKTGCLVSLADLAKQNTEKQLAQRTEVATKVMDYLRGNFGDIGTEEGQTRILDTLSAKLNVEIRTGSAVLGSTKLTKLSDRGPQAKKFVEGITALQRDIGAVQPRGSSENWMRALARKTPIVGGIISRKMNKSKTGEQPIDRLRDRVDTLIGDGIEMRDALRTDQLQSQAIVADLDNKIGSVAALRTQLEHELGQMPAGSVESAFFTQMVGKLEDAEESMRGQSIVLRRGIQRSTLVQTNISEGVATLREVTSVHLLDLEASLTAQVGSGIAEQMQAAATKIKAAAETANQTVAEDILETTQRTVALRRAGLDSKANDAAQKVLAAAKGAQEKFDEDRAKDRKARILALVAKENVEKLAIAAAEQKRTIQMGLQGGSPTKAIGERSDGN